MEPTRDPGLDGVTPFRFACHRCGNCCSGGSGYVWLEEGEIERMAEALGATSAAFSRRFVRSALDPRTGEQRLALIENEAHGGRCALLLGKNTCSVYDARPKHCRTFPYWTSVLEDRTAFEVARATCPGIAVVVDASTRASAFAALSALYERLGDVGARSTCCLSSESIERTYATALEIDYALADETMRTGAVSPAPRSCASDTSDRVASSPPAHRGPAAAPVERTAHSCVEASSSLHECRFGDRRPLACRAGVDGEAALREIRSIERATNYPAAYAPLAELLKAREVTS